MKLWQTLQHRWQQRMADWLAQRIPPAAQITLNRHNLFIFPSRTGGVYLALTAAIFLLGSNYENNLVLALAYLLFSLFVISMHYCHFNLSGLHIEAIPTSTSYAGKTVRFQIQIHTRSRRRYDLHLTADGAIGEHLPELAAQDQLGVSFLTQRRGWLHPGRLRLSSQWPLGLLQCWTLIDLQQRVLVYPQPQPCELQLQADDAMASGDRAVSAHHQTTGMDEIQGVRPYRPGESLSQIAWKQVAQGRGWVSKEFSTPLPEQCWLELRKTPGYTLEEKLSHLCYQLQLLERQGSRYGLLLGQQRIPPGAGEPHQTACLTALALYEEH
jgi:Uncharacterized conserved protein (some members contain a von Willebrand factor type A (vWA) domain)